MNSVLNPDIENKVVILESLDDLKKIKSEKFELCVVKSDFTRMDFLRRFIRKYPKVEFWISANDVSRADIIKANNCGVKNIVSNPISMKTINEYFKLKTSFVGKNSKERKYSNLSSMKVMIVDDNQMNVELLEEVLAPFSVQTMTFTNPKEAIPHIEKEKFNLFLLDIMMPEISGYDLANKIKNSDNKEVPVVFVSALSDNENKITVYNLGSYAYIEKPFDVNVVRSQLYSILRTKQLEEAIIKSKETFIATVSHDLKTPVNAEIRAIELLLKKQFGDLSNEQTEIMSDVLNSARFMKSMTENLLAKYKIESGNFEISKEPCCLKSVIKDCIEGTKYLLAEKVQKIIVKATVRKPKINADPRELKRVLFNLIANANEHAPKNSIIKIMLDRVENGYSISIMNDGDGISLPNVNDIFERGVTLASSEKRVGTGLGLYIVKQIVKAHSGIVWAESELGKGVKITMVLPK